MKRTILILIAAGMAGALIPAQAQPAPPNESNAPAQVEQPVPPPGGDNGPDAGAPPPPPPEVIAALAANAGTNGVPDENAKGPAVILPSRGNSVPQETIQSEFMPPEVAGTNFNDLNLNFKSAPLEMVLNYLSDAAGFVIVQDTRVNGTVTVNGKHLTRDEAVSLLNAVLNKNGYAAIRDGRTLTIVDKNDAKTRDIPVKSGNNPDDIPKNAEIVTQIIPIRFVEARQLVSDLASFVSPQATVVANEAGNSIVITDTQANIRHVAEIIRAIDNSAEAETEIRVFHLKYANPSDVATELASVFPSSSSGNTAQAPTRFGGGGGPGGFFARMMAANAGGGGGGSQDRIKRATQVNAVADARIQAVIVTAPKDMMGDIASMMKEMDVPSDRDQDVYVFKSSNGDPQQIAQVLQTMFQTTSSRNTTGQNQTSALQQRAQTTVTTTSQNTSSSGFGSSSGGGGVRGGTLP